MNDLAVRWLERAFEDTYRVLRNQLAERQMHEPEIAKDLIVIAEYDTSEYTEMFKPLRHFPLLNVFYSIKED